MDVVKPIAHGSLVVNLNEPVLIEGPPRIAVTWPDMGHEEVFAIVDENTIDIPIPTPLEGTRRGIVGTDKHEVRFVVTAFKGEAATVTYTIVAK